MAIEVIGAGLPRTGTMSQKLALELLGYDKCYHMIEFLAHPHHLSMWREMYDGRTADLDALFEGFRATVDWPSSLLYRQLMEYFPDAKVVLSIRDADAWYESCTQTVYTASPQGLEKLAVLLRMPFNANVRKLTPVMRMAERGLWRELFEGRFDDRSYAIDRYHRYNQEVKETVPAERLLVYELGEGWEPLCQFLGVPVPEEPFPHINKRKDFEYKRQQIMRGEAPSAE